VIKTAWWPVAAEGLTAMPVWDPELNPPARSGNSYPGWARVVAVDPTNASLGKTAAVQFIGRSFPRARRVRLEALHHVAVDAAMAKQMAQDPESNRTAIMALGRPIAVNDRLALVGINMMTREQHDWVWAAFWWHDRPEVGPFAADRPSALRGPWQNYLMQAAFDAETPRASDGGAHICFNPWLEGRFPEGGQGGGDAPWMPVAPREHTADFFGKDCTRAFSISTGYGPPVQSPRVDDVSGERWAAGGRCLFNARVVRGGCHPLSAFSHTSAPSSLSRACLGHNLAQGSSLGLWILGRGADRICLSD